jgi:hypothetical protein
MINNEQSYESVYQVLTPAGSFDAVFGEDETPVEYRGNDTAIQFFKNYLAVNQLSGEHGHLLNADNLEPDDLYGFCQPTGSGISVLPPFDDLMFYAQDEQFNNDPGSPVLDNTTQEFDNVATVTGIEKLKLAKELGGIRGNIKTVTSGIEKLKLVKRIGEIRVILGGNAKTVTDPEPQEIQNPWNLTTQEYLSAAKEELGIEFENFSTGTLLDQHYASIQNHVKAGGKITKSVFESLDSGKQYHFAKHYGDKSIISNADDKTEFQLAQEKAKAEYEAQEANKPVTVWERKDADELKNLEIFTKGGKFVANWAGSMQRYDTLEDAQDQIRYWADNLGIDDVFGEKQAKSDDRFYPGDIVYLEDAYDENKRVPVNFRGYMDNEKSVVVMNGSQMAIETNRLFKNDIEPKTENSPVPVPGDSDTPVTQEGDESNTIGDKTEEPGKAALEVPEVHETTDGNPLITAFETELNSLKLETDIVAFDKRLDEIYTRIEKAGLAEEMDGILNEAADVLTGLLAEAEKKSG